MQLPARAVFISGLFHVSGMLSLVSTHKGYYKGYSGLYSDGLEGYRPVYLVCLFTNYHCRVVPALVSTFVKARGIPATPRIFLTKTFLQFQPYT